MGGMRNQPVLEPVHRPEDGELVGHLAVTGDDAGWMAHAVPWTTLRDFPTREEAESLLHAIGQVLIA